jgi:hypothetical protein
MPDPVRSALVIDAEDDTGRAPPPQATSGPPSALSMIASRKRVRIPIAGKPVVVPSWDFDAMQELLRTAYILDGWVAMDTVGSGLDQVKEGSDGSHRSRTGARPPRNLAARKPLPGPCPPGLVGPSRLVRGQDGAQMRLTEN